MRLDIMLDKRLFAGPGRAQREQVITLLLNPDTEIDRFDRPRLTNQFSKILQFRGCFKFELTGITTTIKRIGFKFLYRHIRVLH